jgi:O-antigen/teichoic acid export membrane protein
MLRANKTTGRSLSKRISAFGTLPLIGSIAPLLVLPIIARSVDANQWASLLTCQAIGSFAAVVILSGWGINGQAAVALESSPARRRDIYWTSLRSRILVSLIVLPLALAVGILLASRSMLVTSGLILVSSAWSGYTLSWFSIGCGRASWIATYELLPRLLATVASAYLVLMFGFIWLYPVSLVLSMSVGLSLFHKFELGSWLPQRMRRTASLPTAERRRGAALSMVGAAYAAAPLPVASALGLPGRAGLASADRLYRYALFAIHTLANALQEWVLGSERKNYVRSQLIAIRLHASLGLVGVTIAVLCGPALGRLFFGSQVAPSATICAWYGFAFFFLSLSTPLVRNLLIPAYRSGLVLCSTTVSGCLGLCSMMLLGPWLGSSGVAASLALAEMANFLILAPPALKLLRSHSRSEALHDRSRQQATLPGG